MVFICWLHSWVDCASEPIIYMNGINLQFAEQMQEFQYLWWQTRVSKGSLLPENARTSRQSSAFQACVLKTCDVIAEVGTVWTSRTGQTTFSFAWTIPGIHCHVSHRGTQFICSYYMGIISLIARSNCAPRYRCNSQLTIAVYKLWTILPAPLYLASGHTDLRAWLHQPIPLVRQCL